MVSRLLPLSALRHLRRHPWQTGLSIVGIALGVAVVVAVDLANQSARQAFMVSAERLTGKATHQVVAGPAGVAESVYRTLRVERRLRQSAPVVEGFVQHGDDTLRLVGVDPLAEAPFRSWETGTSADAARRLFVEPDTALLSAITARRLGLDSDDPLALSVAGRPATLRIVGLLDSDTPAALEGLLVTDISTAQELLGRVGRLDRIDLILEPRQAEALDSALPAGLHLEIPAARTRVMSEMVAAFQTNLTAMSLLALLVGAFLIYNTMTFSVLRRRQSLATLRILGVTRRSIFFWVLVEALLLGLVGTALGLLLGTLTAHYLVHLVTRTINDLYFVLTVTQLMVTPLVLVKGACVGLGITLLASCAPALEAAGTLPAQALRRSLLEHRVHRGLRWLTLAGVVALPAGWWLAGNAAYGLVGGYVGLFLVIGGYSLLVPLGVSLLSRIGGRLARRFGLLTRLTLRGIDANLSRTGLAIAALGVAVAATLGVSIMIGSFRATVVDWLDYTLSGDIYVSALSSQSGDDDALPPQVRARIGSLPGVAATSGGRRVIVNSEYGDVTLLALDPAARSQTGFRFAAPPLADLWSRYRRGEVLLVSEPYAWHHHLRTGDSLRLHTLRGPLTLPIGGVFYDYGSERGLVSLVHASYTQWWNDAALSTLGVFLEPGVATAGVVAAIHSALDGLDVALRIRSDREIREQSLAIFDRTFAITRILRLLAIGVAFVGVFSALLALQLERTREQAILRATGVTPGQLARLTLAQTGLMGVYAGVLSLPLGWLMARVLIDVINRRAFGWSIEAQLPSTAVPEALLLAVSAALLAGLYPAWRMRRVQPALALRAE